MGDGRRSNRPEAVWARNDPLGPARAPVLAKIVSSRIRSDKKASDFLKIAAWVCQKILKFPAPVFKFWGCTADLLSRGMAIYRLIANGSFGPEQVKAMTAAYEAALLDLGLVDRDDPITEIVATSIVIITSMGERDPETIKNRALNMLGVGKFGEDAA